MKMDPPPGEGSESEGEVLRLVASTCLACGCAAILVDRSGRRFLADLTSATIAGDRFDFLPHLCGRMVALSGDMVEVPVPVVQSLPGRAVRLWVRFLASFNPSYDTRIGHGQGCICQRCHDIRTEWNQW